MNPFSPFHREPPPPRSVAYPTHLTLHLNPSEVGPDVTVTVTFGKVDADNEVVLASGMRNERGIAVTTSQAFNSSVVGRVLTWDVAGDVVSFEIRFFREKPHAEDIRKLLK